MNSAPTAATPLQLEALAQHEAPDAAQPALNAVQERYGFLPNLVRSLANVPSVLDGYLAIAQAFGGTSFSPVEQQLVLITASAENNCNYCTAAHGTFAKGALNVPEETIQAILDRRPLSDAKQDALVNFTREVVNQRGVVADTTTEAFLGAGYTREQAFEVLLGGAQKLISNYFNHLSPTAIDPEFGGPAA